MFEHLDLWSFATAFLIGVLCFWIYTALRKAWPQIRPTIRSVLIDYKRFNQRSVDLSYRRSILNKAQKTHLAGMLFPLDDVLIIPRVLAPPPRVDPRQPAPLETIVNQVIRYLPDWPELASQYFAPTLDLFEILNRGSNLILIGEPGSGKSTALAYLASSLARHEPQTGELKDFIPFLIHYSELVQLSADHQDPAEILVNSALSGISSPPPFQASGFLHQQFERGNAFLLLDGLDELLPAQVKEVTVFLDSLLKRYPQTRIVTVSNPDYWDGLSRLGLQPLVLACWNRQDIRQIIGKWEAAWKNLPGSGLIPEGRMISSWIQSKKPNRTALEWTLRIWSAFNPDDLGISRRDVFDSYVRRFISGTTERELLEKCAERLIRAKTFTFDHEWETSRKEPLDADMLRTLSSKGFVILLPQGNWRFAHPFTAAFLSAPAFISDAGKLKELMIQPGWLGQQMTLDCLSSLTDTSPCLNQMLTTDSAPLHRNLFRAARWLREAPPDSSWRFACLSKLVELAQDEDQPVSMRQRALAALISCEDASLHQLFRDWARSRSATLRHMGALGIGSFGDVSGSEILEGLLQDMDCLARDSACLGLSLLGNQTALEAVARVLLSGDERSRRAAAEALSLDPGEGYAVLREGNSLSDPFVRKAVVYGLNRVPQPWADGLLNKTRREDNHYTVRTAAIEVLEFRAHPNPSLPRKLPPPSQSPWLIAFAARMGGGIPAGVSATDKLIAVLQTGSIEEQIASLEYLTLTPEPQVIQAILSCLPYLVEEVRDQAITTLWRHSGMGAPVFYSLMKK